MKTSIFKNCRKQFLNSFSIVLTPDLFAFAM